MVLDYYQLQRMPFGIAADPEFLYWSPSHKEALRTIEYGVSQRRGLLVVIGEVGLGKTILLQAFLRDRSPAKIRILSLLNSRVSSTGLIKALCREMSEHFAFDEPDYSFKKLHRALIQEYERGNTVVLLVDDAQNLPKETLQDLHLLSNLEARTEKLLQIILVGRPEFWGNLERHEVRQLKQRVALVVRLSPLTREESREYIQFRLGKAGVGERPLFTKGALKCIGKVAEGIPRKINILCSYALKTGYDQLQKQITRKIVEEVAEELQGSKNITPVRWALPVLVGVPVVLGVLILADNYRFFIPKVQSLFSSPSWPTSSGPIVTGPVIENGVSTAAPVFRPFRTEDFIRLPNSPAPDELLGEAVAGSLPQAPKDLSRSLKRDRLPPTPKAEENHPVASEKRHSGEKFSADFPKRDTFGGKANPPQEFP
jgi:type II secretory pathway predicted ATPase ExeA